MKIQFRNSVHLNEERRYEEALHWTYDHLSLFTNENLALKTLEALKAARSSEASLEAQKV